MPTTIDLRCGSCQTQWITLTERRDEPVEISLRSNVGFHFDVNNHCTAICGTCGAATELRLTKSVAAQLRSVFDLSQS
jgi:hypothetical protein